MCECVTDVLSRKTIELETNLPNYVSGPYVHEQ